MSAQALLLELERPVPAPPAADAPPSQPNWASKAAAALVMVLTTAGFYLLLAMGRGPPASIVETFPRSAHRSLRGAGGVYPVTSPNGGQPVSPAGVPWAPFSIAEAQSKYPINAKRMVANGLVGQVRQDNKMEDNIYSHIRVYAKLQDRAEDQALVARLQGGLSSPTYVQLRERISDPNFQYSLQAGMYRRGAKYQLMNDRVSDPAYLANVQAQLYPGALRPGPPHHTQYSDQATAVEARPRPFRPTHVP